MISREEKTLGGKGGKDLKARRSQGGKGLKISGGGRRKDLNRERGQRILGRKREKI